MDRSDDHPCCATTPLDVRIIQIGYGDDESVQARVDRVADLVANQAGADLVVLPELWAPGGFAYDKWAERAESIDGPIVAAVREAARAANAVVHAGSFIERGRSECHGPEQLWNTSVLVDRGGEVIATYRKVHRFGFGQGEPKLLAAGRETVTADLARPDGTSTRLGLATCYDLRFPELFRRLVDAGAEVLVVPAAWPMARVGHWELLGRARAVENQAFVVQCNTTGAHAGTSMGGRSQIVDPLGNVLAAAPPDSEGVITASIDPTVVQSYRQSFPVLRDRQVWI